MLKKISFVSLLFFAISSVALLRAEEPKKFDTIDTSLHNMEAEFGIQPKAEPAATAPVAAAPKTETTPLVLKKPATKPKLVTAAEDEPPTEVEPYHYSYVPDASLDKDPDYEKHSAVGQPGIFFISFFGQALFYNDYDQGKPGFEFETGLQFSLFKYMSVAFAFNAGYRKGFVSGDDLYPLGLSGQLRLRALPWLFPFFEGGFECIKLARSGWEPASMVIGGGVMIRIGYADKKSEYNFYKATSVKRIMLILAFDHSSASDLVPSTSIFKGGLSVEF